MGQSSSSLAFEQLYSRYSLARHELPSLWALVRQDSGQPFLMLELSMPDEQAFAAKRAQLDLRLPLAQEHFLGPV
jgi:serine/threonine protein kinase